MCYTVLVAAMELLVLYINKIKEIIKMDVLVTPNGINPLDASFPGDGANCAYSACGEPFSCTCNRGSCYDKNQCVIDFF